MSTNRTNASFPNLLPPEIVRFDASPPAGRLVVVYRTPDALFIRMPASFQVAESPTRELLDRLSELKKRYSTPFLPHSTPPTDAAFQNARDFILTLPLNRMLMPTIHVASDGEVNFQWSGADYQIDLGFYGNGKFSFYGRKNGSNPILGDEIAVKDGIPKDLANFASAV